MSGRAIIVNGFGFGDESKGATVDYLARQAEAVAVVRYNGGAQAAHNVITPDGRHHTFAQFGSGTFVPGTKTYLSRFMLVNPLTLLNEGDHLVDIGELDAFSRMYVDYNAPVTTPFHVIANKLREISRGNGLHGSCGMGIGETMSDLLSNLGHSLFVKDLKHPYTVRLKLEFIQNLKISELRDILPGLPDTDIVRKLKKDLFDGEIIEQTIDVYREFLSKVQLRDQKYLKELLDEGTVIFEGAQGVLLDEWYGFHPHTTWSTTTFARALELLRDVDFLGETTKLALFRAYSSRHGRGPLPTEDAQLTQTLVEPHNVNNAWQHGFRTGYFDLPLADYAIEVAGVPDYLVISHLDNLNRFPQKKVCTSYGYLGEFNPDFFEYKGSNHVYRIRSTREQDLSRQEELGKAVESCIPLYTYLGNIDATSYAAYIAQTLGIPIGITSAGPTALDRNCSVKFRREVLERGAVGVR